MKQLEWDIGVMWGDGGELYVPLGGVPVVEQHPCDGGVREEGRTLLQQLHQYLPAVVSLVDQTGENPTLHVERDHGRSDVAGPSGDFK